MVLAGGGRGAKHGSTSPYDMRNSLIAWGPRFKRSVRNAVPAGIVDVAPTVAHILGLAPLPADGRVLHESLDGGPSPADVAWTEARPSASVAWPGGAYRQEVQIHRVGSTAYLAGASTWHE